MKDMGLLRAKIAACVARGGMADEDCPDDPDSTRYRCTLITSEDSTDRDDFDMQISGSVDASQMLPLWQQQGNAQQRMLVNVPDPLAVVRAQLASAPATPASSVSGAAQPSVPAGTINMDVNITSVTCIFTPNTQNMSIFQA